MTIMFGYLMGALLVIIGIATYLWAPRVGPNPFFGVRTGYSFANRQVWDQSNRVGGLAMTSIGVLLLGVAAVLHLVSAPLGTSILVLTGVMLTTLLGMTGWLFFYTRRLALGSDVARSLTPLRLDWSLFAPAVGAWALLAVVTLAVYPGLPEILVTHFDAAGEPNGWSSRTSFTILYLGLGLLMAVIPSVAALIARTEPVIGLSRLGGWRLEPRQGILVSSWGMGLANLFLLVVLLDLVWFNWYAVHLLSPGILVLLGMVVLLGGVLILFFRYARRSQS
ncbi:MAG: DUF1648 domain-containing protein [Anaerolineae bacterium]|nr:DUF1648 domain-containing protein [Anaerolineae bacterium]